MEPAREVGGDLYDCFYAGEHTFCFLVGDVCGKGASAAMFMARARSLVRITVNLWRQWRADDIDPGALLEAVNSRAVPGQRRLHVRDDVPGLDRHPQRARVVRECRPSSALPGFDHRRDAADRPRSRRCLLVFGATPASRRGPSRFFLAMRCSRARTACSKPLNDQGDLFSIERLSQLLREVHAAEPREMVRVIKDAVDAFTGCAPRTDDVTALALRWLPAERDRLASDRVGRRMTHAVDVRIRNDVSDIGIIRDTLDQPRPRIRNPSARLDANCR